MQIRSIRKQYYRNHFIAFTRASAVDKSNKAGDVYGKMLVLTFEDNEDDMMNRILSLINTREEITQMSGLKNHLLNFKGLMIDEVQRVIIREKIENNPSKPVYIQTVWGVGYKFNNKLK